MTEAIAPYTTLAPSSNGFPSLLQSSSDLAAAKRTGRGRGRTTGRGRVRPRDLDDDPPINGSSSNPTSIVFAAAATSTSDETRRELLLRRLNEITHEKERLEKRQLHNGTKESIPEGNGVERTAVSRGPTDDRDPMDIDYPSYRSRDDSKATDLNGTRRKHSGPPKHRRHTPAEDVVTIQESPPRHTEGSHRNGKHPSSKGKGPASKTKPTPPAIDLDAVVDPSPSASLEAFTNDRPRSKSNRLASLQGSPTVSARGSGRLRTPSVLLSSHPGEKAHPSQFVTKNRSLGFCLRLVKDMVRLKDGFAFSQPIDELWTRDQLPGYFDTVKQPMDLGTIRKRLEGDYYMKYPGKDEVEELMFQVEAFKTDMRLVFQNAHKYNRPGDVFYDAATRLLDKFNTKMELMPSPEELEQQAAKKSKKRKKGLPLGDTAPRRLESSKKRKVAPKRNDGDENGAPTKRGVGKKKLSAATGAKARGSSSSAPKKKKLAPPEVVEVKDTSGMSAEDMEVRLRALKRQRTLLQNGSPASPPAGGGSYMAQAQALYHVEMTFQEKVQLSNNVGKLPPDKLQKIVALATKNKGSSMEVNNNEEIELDIDSMNNETLREMEAYVNQILSKKKKGGPAVVSPNADILQMTTSQVSNEIDKLMGTLRKKTKGKSKELVSEEGKGGGSKEKTQKSFYDSDSSSDSDDSDGSGSGSSDDSSSGSSDSSDEESDGETMRKRRERNLAHQKAMQSSGTPLPSPPYQDSLRSS